MSSNIIIASFLIALVVGPASQSAKAQNPDAEQQIAPLFRSESMYVWVPTLVKAETGESLTHLDLHQVQLSDNGTSERLTEVNTDGLPVSLVILMQTGGSAGRFLSCYADLPDLVERFVGASVREITLITFDSRVEEIWHFPARIDGVTYALTHQRSGDSGASIQDALALGVRQLQDEPGRFRRVVLLLSEGSDFGSATSSQSLLEQLGESSTVIYSLTFPGRDRTRPRAKKRQRAMSRDEALEESIQKLEQRTAEEIAYLTGGTHSHFDDQRSFNSAMLETLSDFHDAMTIGFQPSHHEVGFHRIRVKVEHPKLHVVARGAYWVSPPR